MGFTGAIPQPVRAHLRLFADHWKGKEVHIGCSGNFTAERTLANAGLTDFHSNDVSLYSCALGSYLTGQPMRLEVVNPEIEWVNEYIDKGPLETIATLMLLLDNLGYSRQTTLYHTRMWNAFVRHFPEMHEKTVDKVTRALEGLKIKRYFAGDVVDFVEQAPDDVPMLAFPPTYKAGYEKLYERLDESFDWDRPSYVLFDEDRFNYFADLLLKKEEFYVLRDHEIPQLEEWKVAVVQTGPRTRPVHVYARLKDMRVVFPHTTTEPVNLPPVEELTEKIHLKHLTIGQFNTLRSKYLKRVDDPVDPSWKLAIVTDNEQLIGCLGFSRSMWPWCDVYMMSDFSSASQYKRLSKLVVAVSLTREVRDFLEQGMSQRVRTIGTTAFTAKPVSMKYRSVFELHKRDEEKNRLNYVGIAGKWTLEEAYTWWKSRYGSLMTEELASAH